EDDAEPGGGEAVREVERLVEGVEEAEIHAELAHRLEREADVCPLRLRQEGLDERTGAARRLLPGERARRPGQHEEAARSELGRERRGVPLERPAEGRDLAHREAHHEGSIPAAGRERQGAWPEARPLGYPRPRADRGERPATRRRRTHRPTLAPRRGRAAGG